MQPTVRTAITVDPAQLKQVAGRYRLIVGNDTIPVVMQFQDGVLSADVRPLSATPMRLYAAEPNRFFNIENPAEFAFDRDSTSAVSAVRILNVGQPLRAVKLP
jgi:hypothetical protein